MSYQVPSKKKNKHCRSIEMRPGLASMTPVFSFPRPRASLSFATNASPTSSPVLFLTMLAYCPPLSSSDPSQRNSYAAPTRRCQSIRLHDINLRSNRLKEIPNEMGALVRLNRLNLAHNHLERRLPDHLGLLTGLTDLDLSDNNIGHLPPSLGALEASHAHHAVDRVG